MKRKYEPLLIFFTLFVVAIVIGEIVTGCTFSFGKTPGVSSFACKDDDLSGYILNLVFQTFIILIMLIWNYLVYAKRNSNK